MITSAWRQTSTAGAMAHASCLWKFSASAFLEPAPTRLRRALKMLGINDVYHGLPAFFENPRDCEMWYQAHEAKYEGEGKVFVREEFKMLLGHWSQITFAAFSQKSSSTSIRRRKLFRKRGRRRYGISAYDPSLAG